MHHLMASTCASVQNVLVNGISLLEVGVGLAVEEYNKPGSIP